MVDCDREEGTKSDSIDLALPKIRALTRDEVRRKEVGDDGHRVGLSRRFSMAKNLVDPSSKVDTKRGVDNTTSLLLALGSSSETSLVG